MFLQFEPVECSQVCIQKYVVDEKAVVVYENFNTGSCTSIYSNLILKGKKLKFCNTSVDFKKLFCAPRCGVSIFTLFRLAVQYEL